jgi:hypothetical protein
MKFKCDVSVSAIFATVRHSPFSVAPPFSPTAHLPRGYGRADVKILNWIVSAATTRGAVLH